MKLAPRDIPGFVQKPDPGVPVVLLYGTDPIRVATRRRELIDALVGPDGEAEMRLTRLAAADLRRDGAAVGDAMRAQGFFPGRRAVLVEDATDGLAPVLKAALEDWREGDATLVVTAGALKASSALRKLVEGHRSALAAPLYDTPPGEDEVMRLAEAAGLRPPQGEGRAALLALSRALDPGDFRQTVEKLGLYMLGEDRPPEPEDIAAVAPGSTEAETDALVAVVAEGRTDEIAEVLRRLYAQGVLPVTICIQLLRHIRQLHTAASDPGGASAGVGRLRPPAYGPRRDAMIRQAGLWGREGLERAMATLIDTDLALRSADQRAPARALVERALIRLAMMARSRR